MVYTQVRLIPQLFIQLFKINFLSTFNCFFLSTFLQVVTLATYLFFIFTLIGRQKIQGYGVRDNGKDVRMASGRIPIDIDLYIPIFTVLQFFFYMGLLKVAEQLINPFGDDDEDFELNWLIDRHVKVKFSAKPGQNTLCSTPSSCAFALLASLCRLTQYAAAF